MKLKKIMSLVATTILATAMVACASTTQPTTTPSTTSPVSTPTESTTTTQPELPPASVFKVGMVTDTGGVHDQSFNQSSWEGLQAFQSVFGSAVHAQFLESKQESDYLANFDILIDDNYDLIWGVGFLMGDGVLNAAKQNPDRLFGIIDYSYAPEDGDNLIGVEFKAEQPSFLVGYAAGKTTETDRVGFIGGISGAIIDQFEYGYRAGVAYAAHELGKDIQVDIQYADSFTDATKGKAIASQMYTNGADIVFHAAGGVGIGLIEAAIEFDRYAIGVDRDQSDAAPNHVLTSAMKNVGRAMYLVSEEIKDGRASELGGTTTVLGIEDSGVGIPERSLLEPAVKDATDEIEQSLVDGTIVAPANLEEFEAFLLTLQ